MFAFDIQVTLADASKVQTNKPTRKVISLAPDQPKYRILAVDDRLESRLLLVKLLTNLGFAVREVANGQDAIALNDLANNFLFDQIIDLIANNSTD